MPYWEDVEEGISIPSLQKHPTTQMLVMYCGASGDFYQIHYDSEFAKSRGLPGVVVQGGLKNAFLAQLVTDWIGDSGRLRKTQLPAQGHGLPRRYPALQRRGLPGCTRRICGSWSIARSGWKTAMVKRQPRARQRWSCLPGQARLIPADTAFSTSCIPVPFAGPCPPGRSGQPQPRCPCSKWAPAWPRMPKREQVQVRV